MNSQIHLPPTPPPGGAERRIPKRFTGAPLIVICLLVVGAVSGCAKPAEDDVIIIQKWTNEQYPCATDILLVGGIDYHTLTFECNKTYYEFGFWDNGEVHLEAKQKEWERWK